MQRFMAERGLAHEYACPALPPLAEQAICAVERRLGPNDCFIGSSLGGFYATYLAEKHRLKAVLINPAIDPHVGLRAYLGPQKNLHTGEPYELTEAHLRQWEKLYVPRISPRRFRSSSCGPVSRFSAALPVSSSISCNPVNASAP